MTISLKKWFMGFMGMQKNAIAYFNFQIFWFSASYSNIEPHKQPINENVIYAQPMKKSKKKMGNKNRKSKQIESA